MKYVYIKDGGPVVFPDTKLPLEKYGLKKPIAEITDQEFENSNGLIRIINNKVFIGYTELEKKEIESEKKRKIRDEILISTDKYVLYDYPISTTELEIIKSYRKYLRDIPQNKKFPYINIISLEEFKKQKK